MSKVRQSKVQELIPDDKNFNKGTPFGEALIEKSFSKFGAGRSILLDKNNRIIAGNKSTQKFSESGGEDVLVVETDGKTLIAVKRMDIDLDSPEGREMALADNASAKANIILDAEVIIAELGEARAEEWAIELPQQAVIDDNFVAEVPIKPITKLGDIYELNDHRILCGDSTKKQDVELLMGDETAELLFTSPPYSDMRNYNGGKDLSIQKLIQFIPQFHPFSRYQVINLGIQRKDHEIVPYWDSYINMAKESGYKFLSWNVWNREQATGIGLQVAFFPIYHEWIFVFGKENGEIKKTKPLRQGSKDSNRYTPSTRRAKSGELKRVKQHKLFGNLTKMGTVMTCKAANTINNNEHPASFPVTLPLEYIKAMTSSGNIVIDPFLGSATTMIAADQLSRICYGMELDCRYTDISVARFIKYKQGRGEKFTILKNGHQLSKTDINHHLDQIQAPGKPSK